MSYFQHSNELPSWAAGVPEAWGSDWLKWSVGLSTKRPTDEQQEALPYISNEDIASWTGKLLIEEPKPAEADSRVFQNNDVLFNKLRPYLAKVFPATFDGVSSGELLCLRPSRAVEPRFLFYVLVSNGFIDTINAETFGAKMPRADWEIVGHQPLPLPPIETQRRIVDFLDEKTSRIDSLIENKRKLLSFAFEHFEAAQQYFVTTGSSDQPFKSTGYDWFPRIPKNWEIMKLKYLFRLLSGYAFKSEDFRKGDGELPTLVTPGSFNPLGGIYDQSDADVGFAGEAKERFHLRKGDLVIAMTDLSYKKLILGRCEAIPNNGFILNQRIAKIEQLSNRVDRRFIRYALNARSSRKQIEETATGSTVFHSSADKIRSVLVCVPPIADQITIADQLENLERRLVETNTKISSSVERLRELRAAIVTSAVIGQVPELL